MNIKKEYFFEVILGWACNLDCNYCYQKDSPLYWKNIIETLKVAKITKKSLLNIIKLIKRYSWEESTIWVIIYWWEPFVHKENLIFFIENFFNSNILNITDLSILSNWTIIDHDILKIANKYSCYIDCCWHSTDINDFYTKNIFWDKHKEFLEVIQNDYKKITLISHIVISDKIIDLFPYILNYYKKCLNWNSLIIWFDYVESDWNNKENLRKLFKVLLLYKKNVQNYPFIIKFEPLVCKAWSFTTRHKSSGGLHLLPNWDIFWCWYVSVAKNISKERYERLKISNLEDFNLYKNIDIFFDRLSLSNKILCERDEYAPSFSCFLNNKWIKKIWWFVNKYMKEFL